MCTLNSIATLILSCISRPASGLSHQFECLESVTLGLYASNTSSLCALSLYTHLFSTHQTSEIMVTILETSWLTVQQISQSITPQPLDQTLWAKFGLIILECQDPHEHIQGYSGLPTSRSTSSRGKRKGINVFFLRRVSASEFWNEKEFTKKNRDIVKAITNILKGLPRTWRTCFRGKPKGVKAFSAEGKGSGISKRKGTYK